jgi:hypothetical protein
MMIIVPLTRCYYLDLSGSWLSIQARQPPVAIVTGAAKGLGLSDPVLKPNVALVTVAREWLVFTYWSSVFKF